MNKSLWIVVVVLLAVGGYYWMKSDAIMTGSPTGSQATASPSVSATAKPAAVNPKATATPVQLTYTQLVAQYKDRTIQFNETCQATPKTFVLKNNTSVLLDNRSSSARTIVVDGQTYALGGYGYQVVTLSSNTLPRTIGVNCGSSVNVSTVKLQANISGE